MPNGRIISENIYTNTVPRGHMRAPGMPQVCFAVESHTDLCARVVGLDPGSEFRARTPFARGDTSPIGEPLAGVNLIDIIDAAAEKVGWNEPAQPDTGRGMALATFHLGAGKAGCELRIEPDGMAAISRR